MEKSMTSGKEWRVILLFSLPIMGSNFLQVLYTFVDSVIVGNYVSSNALGAIGLTSSMTWLLVTCCTGVGAGISIGVSQYFGAGRKKDIREMVVSAYFLAITASLVITLFCFIGAKPVIWGFLETPVEMQSESYQYFVIYGCGILFQMLYNVTYGILRAHGDSKSALIFLVVSAVFNVVLDIIFVIFFQWGVIGAAVATVISQAGAAIASLLYLRKHFKHLLPAKNELIIRVERIKTILRLSIPIILQSMITAFGFIILQRLVNSFGTPSIEGYTAMQRVEQFAHIPSNCFNTAISCFAGQNVGAGLYERVKKGYRSTLIMAGSISILISVIVILTNDPILHLFNIKGDSFLRAQEHLELLMCFMVVNTIHNITSGFLQGTGDVKLPAVTGLVNLSIRLAAAYIMAETVIGYRSIYYSLPLAWVAACAISLFRYYSGKWKNYKIV